MLNKQNNWRNKKYLQWVRLQPSIVSGQYGCDPHHLKGHGLTGGTTAPDWAVIPLTREEHTLLHDIGYKSWEVVYGSQADLLLQFWRDNFEELKEFM